MPLSIFSYLGIIALIGIIVNDSLVLVSKMNTFLKEGMEFKEAVYQAGVVRFRAIFLTSLTTIAGLAPLMLEKSFQAQFLIPIAVSVSYGIAIATVITLIMLGDADGKERTQTPLPLGPALIFGPTPAQSGKHGAGGKRTILGETADRKKKGR